MFDVSGKSISDLLAIPKKDLDKLTTKELTKIATRLNSAANKRLKRANIAGFESPAIVRAKASGGFYKSKIKDRSHVEYQLYEVRNFLKAPTSSQRSARAYYKDKAKQIKNNNNLKGVSISKLSETLMRYDTMAERLLARHPEWTADPRIVSQMYRSVQEAQSADVDYMKLDEIEQAIEEKVQAFINESEKQYKDVSTSSFTDI